MGSALGSRDNATYAQMFGSSVSGFAASARDALLVPEPDSVVASVGAAGVGGASSIEGEAAASAGGATSMLGEFSGGAAATVGGAASFKAWGAAASGARA